MTVSLGDRHIFIDNEASLFCSDKSFDKSFDKSSDLFRATASQISWNQVDKIMLLRN